MIIRFVSAEDADELLEIYGQYIDTPVTFEYTLPTREEFQERIRFISSFYPNLVCEDNGKIIGYAYAHRQMERAAYQWNAELSIYLDSACVSRGIGTKLYTYLMDLLAQQGVKTVYGVVTLPNARSEGLHASLGFRLLGIHKNTGYKNGRWHDVAWFEKPLAPYEADPSPIRSIHSFTIYSLYI